MRKATKEFLSDEIVKKLIRELGDPVNFKFRMDETEESFAKDLNIFLDTCRKERLE